MIGPYCDKTHDPMTNYDDEDEDGDADGNENENATSGSESDGTIFGLTTTPRYRRVIWVTTATALWPQCTIYLCTTLYICTINNILKMCHKLMYVKFGVLDWCLCYMENFQFN